jgi:hypothetical protein
MLAKVWRHNVCLTAAAVFYWAGVGAPAPARSAEAATTNFGKSIFAVLDDRNPLIRRYGWASLEVLGSLSGPNELHTETFKRFLDRDGRALGQRIETLLVKRRGKTMDGGLAKAESAEFDALRQSALGVPEIAALVVSAPGLRETVAATELEEFRSAAARIRPEARPYQLLSRPNGEIGALVSLLGSPPANDRESRLDAATTLAGVRLAPPRLDALEQLIRNRPVDIDVRHRLAIALVRNRRAPAALAFVDELLADPKATSDFATFALQTLTELVFTDPAMARRAISERGPALAPLLGDFEHVKDASAVLSQLAGDEIAKMNAQALMKRIEGGAALRGSACVYASTIARSPQAPLGLALFGRMAQDSDEPADTAACIMFLDPGGVGSAYLRDFALGDRPGNNDDRQRQFAYLDTLWTQSGALEASVFPMTTDAVHKALVHEAGGLADALPLFSLSAVNNVATWAGRAESFGLATSFSRPYWTRWMITRVPGFASALAAWLFGVMALVLMSHSDGVRAFLLFHPLGRQLGAFGQVNALMFAIPVLRRKFFAPYRSAMLGILAQQDARGYDDKTYFSGSGAAPLEKGGIAGQLRDLDRRTVSGSSSAAAPVVSALRAWHGRIVLIGASGRGKTMFLRHHILGMGGIREPAVFATASSLGRDPHKAITGRFGGALTDDGFLDSLITSARLDLYIDGLNEVDVETRAVITDYVTARPGANIFITTQPLERYPGDAALFFPLAPDANPDCGVPGHARADPACGCPRARRVISRAGKGLRRRKARGSRCPGVAGRQRGP